MSQMVQHSTWNFLNKLELLKAELHYLDGRHADAEISYKASIASAHNHKFIQEEALACELYGIFCIENRQIEKGTAQLQLAIAKYTEWGAAKKAEDVKQFLDLISLANIWTLTAARGG